MTVLQHYPVSAKRRDKAYAVTWRAAISVLLFASTDWMAIVGAYATSLDEGNVGCLFLYSLAMLSLRRSPAGSTGPLFPQHHFMQMRDHLGTIYDHTAFEALYPPCGKPAEAPWAAGPSITVMQFCRRLI